MISGGVKVELDGGPRKIHDLASRLGPLLADTKHQGHGEVGVALRASCRILGSCSGQLRPEVTQAPRNPKERVRESKPRMGLTWPWLQS